MFETEILHLIELDENINMWAVKKNALDKNITKEQLEKYLLYDGRGRKLKIMIGQEKIYEEYSGDL